ncbi:DUF2809 domain-containing protein [Microbacterium sp. zg.Y625]|uniref:ribosomal maturation YjgA family protein n=1 Tax=Microbacterium jiangjiandongii TaxID=3049071 RepID=UPI00214C060B|nr:MULTISPECIES: DUF2809 domain-containing protein [unclassified Microbacterium]MCR2792426.1 DUF2809 domain-containing protein [Microbacterium sp. zg.Y625]MCR2816913.1 DUF2809 domain-containing protein [Microbacterium sp. zg.Y843]WIM26421.1 DUF2809 domain-containing protein [Microbacterium sp. zg-Y625]
MPRPARRRLLAAVLLAATIGAGLAVHRWAPDTAASDIAGDALYALAAYIGLAMLLPRARPWGLGLAAAAWCTAVELLQLTGLPERLGTAFPPAMLLLGTVFDARDLLVYLLMVALAGAVDAALLAAAGRSLPRRTTAR